MLVTIAARDYAYENGTFFAAIDDQVAAVAEWLADPDLGDRAFTEEERRHLSPVNRREVYDFVAEHDLHELDLDDVLVLYVTGHGRRRPSGTHFLCVPDTDEERMLATAVRTSDLVAAVLDSEAEHVLVIVDSCGSGALDHELSGLVQDLSESRRRLRTLAVVTSAQFDQNPRIGEFARVLRTFRERLRTAAGIDRDLLTFDEFAAELAAAARHHGDVLTPVQVWPRPGHGSDPTPCLPNPAYRHWERLLEPAREQLAPPGAVTAGYWLDRASGRMSADDLGWYFTGRREPLTRLTGFLRDGTGVLVVTGGTGTGKSAVVSSVVMLSDPLFRDDERYVAAVESMPEAGLHDVAEGAVDVAVLARNKAAGRIAVEILAALDNRDRHSSATPTDVVSAIDELRGHLLARPGPVTVVVDGLDEAVHPTGVVVEVLGPLARLVRPDGARAVRLVVGVRSERPTPGHDSAPAALVELLRHVATAGGEAAPVVLRVDEEPGVTTDIVGYVTRLLLADGDSPYRGDPDAAARAAAVVAAHVTPSFLDARIAAAWLRDRPGIQDLDAPDWLATLADGTCGLLRDDLAVVAEHTGLSAERLLAVLRASAFALGSGLPWSDVWPAVSAAVMDIDVALLEDVWDVGAYIETIRNSRLNGYLVADVEDERIVYRPSHERLAEVLRDDPRSLLRGGDDD
ncbi:hypothetical protein CLV71_13036 [Actinophytocola oryzae]|uniref:Orc1-like AAA ATPase domain-containing protein n=2 Tax=Actinophytocola oryzae TaxID=502181 RepID=A0A4R7URD3_9PSEU|nr:hypothetical protein CLV71_13036 [Actinophytocola oryzae]